VTVLLAAIRKEVLLLLRDRGALVSLFVLPVAFIAFFGSMFKIGDDDNKHVVAVWIAPDNERAAAAVAALEGSKLFELRPSASAADVRAAVRADSVDFGLVFDAEFEPAAGRPGELVIRESMGMLQRAPLEGALNRIVAQALATPECAVYMRASPLVATTPPGTKSPLEDADGFQVSVTGNVVMFGLFLAVTVALAFVEDRKTGTWRRLLSGPVRPMTLLFAKLVPFYVIGVFQMVFLYAIGILAFGMEIHGSPWGVAAISLAVVYVGVTLGLFVAALGGSAKQIGGGVSVLLLIVAMLGGAMVPREVMPKSIQAFGNITPHAWAIDALHDLVLTPGTKVRDVLPSLLVLLGFGTVFATIGIRRFRFL
jgi:ABC-2 type transport system permease protein